MSSTQRLRLRRALTASLAALLLASGVRAQADPLPTVVYTTVSYSGNGNSPDGAGVAVDSAGNAYVVVNVYSNSNWHRPGCCGKLKSVTSG